MTRDLAHVVAVLEQHGIELLGAGVDPRRSPTRILHAPRYDAMETYFDRFGPHGRVMMTRTASLQVNLDHGDAAAMERRWQLVHALGPTLVAAFANSPLVEGRPTGWRSTRLANWWAMDRSRTAPVGDERPLSEWSDAVLAAQVMLVRTDDHFAPGAGRLTFARWVETGHELGYPTLDDLDYHLTTLFPPVRPRGWFELRYLDALPMAWWPVAAAVTTALLDDDEAADAAARVTGPTRGAWMTAARHALADEALARSAASCFALALDALERLGADAALHERCAAYAESFVLRRRTPADDLLALAGSDPRPMTPTTSRGALAWN